MQNGDHGPSSLQSPYDKILEAIFSFQLVKQENQNRKPVKSKKQGKNKKKAQLTVTDRPPFFKEEKYTIHHQALLNGV